MNTPGNIVGAQLGHLLKHLETHGKARCEELLAQARSEAQHEIRQAYSKARSRLHQAVLDTRESAQSRLTSTTARHQTLERLQHQQEDQALLERAWQPLHDLLQQRWDEQATRELWIDHLIVQATQVLVDTNWKIEHPEHWPAAERHAVEDRLVKLHGYIPVFSKRSSISAGLRINAGKTRVDGTIAGLLHDRARIESMLLARLNECRSAADASIKTGEKP